MSRSLRHMHSFRPTVMGLENRSLMACNVFAAGSVLNIVGDASPDRVFIYDSGSGAVSGMASGHGAFSFNGIKDIVIDTGAGNDHVEHHLVGDLESFLVRTVEVNLRDGNDFYLSSLKNPANNQPHNLKPTSELLMKVVGETGNDVLLFNAAHVNLHQSTMKIGYYGGTGDDIISMGYSGWLDHGGVSFFAYGEDGNDLIGQFFNVDPVSDAPHPGGIRGIIDAGEGDDMMALYLKAPADVSTFTTSVFGGGGKDVLYTNYMTSQIYDVENIVF